MRSLAFLLIFSLCVLPLSSQSRIFGKVLSKENIPLEGVSVYLNNTSIGTYSDEEGKFELFVDQGAYTLILSYVGFETIEYKITAKDSNKGLVFKLSPETTLLNEVVVSNKKMSRRDRARFLKLFRRNFIGRTRLSRNCKILNEDIIQFNFDSETNTLEAHADEPIKILNEGLGYNIEYELVLFELNSEKITYLGYSRYENLEGSKRENRNWRRARKAAYEGSRVHFVRSLLQENDAHLKEGFQIHEFKRILNPKRPSDKEIEEAKLYVKSRQSEKSNSNNLDPSRSVIASLVTPKNRSSNKLNAALKTIEKSKLNRFKEVPLRMNLKTEDIIFNSSEGKKIKFENFLKILYLNEKEESGYKINSYRRNYQISLMTMLSESAILHKTGEIIEPTDVYIEGYWQYEKIADALPLDYYPNRN